MMPVPIHSVDLLANYREPLARASFAQATERELVVAWVYLAARRDTSAATRRVMVLRPFVL